MSGITSDRQNWFLAVCLGLSALLNVVLGGAAYLVFSGRDELAREKADAQAQLTEMRQDAERQLLDASSRHGALLEDCRNKISAAEAGMKNAQEQGKQARAERAYQAAVYDTRIEDYQRKIKDYERRLKASDQVKNQLLDRLQKSSEEVDRRIDELKAVCKALKDAAPGKADLDKAIKVLQDALPDYEANLRRMHVLEAENTKLAADLRTARSDMEIKVMKLEDKVPRIDLLAYEQPKGKISKVEAGQQTVYLNLGSADLVKPGLTFSVFAEGGYRANPERSKASIEVVEVTDEHACRARVTEMRNAARSPLAVGDLLYNPMWLPGVRDHVAVAGMIDLAGDGRDQTAEFVKALEKEGVIVDAWLDLKDLSVKGAIGSINFQTSYLVIGDRPNLELGENDPRQEKLQAMDEAIYKLRAEAMSLGVSIVNARRYMALAGMKAPKAPASQTQK